MMSRSPNNCVSNLIYGVSPQPEHAPENSKSGCCICILRTWSVVTLRRSISGIERKKFQFSRSLSRRGNCGCMLMAFKRASDLFRAGQTSTQIPQPVQSSTDTCSVYFKPFHSDSRASADLNDEGAAWRTAASYTLLRMTACGQTITHLPHWIQTCGSQTGTSLARFRFSNCVLPVGYVPSLGNALTGTRSPRPAMISPSTLHTNCGARLSSPFGCSRDR